LLRLPAELRNAIYGYACTHARVRCSRSSESGEFTTRFTPDSAGLRLACKQLYHEVQFDLQSCKHLIYNGVPKYLGCEFWDTMEEIKVDQIESIVVVRKPKAFRKDDFRLLYASWLLYKWPALRYLEIQGDFSWIESRYLNSLQSSLENARSGEDLEVCIKYDDNDSEWRFNCQDQTLVTRTGLASASG
jgi:hypothetical protein